MSGDGLSEIGLLGAGGQALEMQGYLKRGIKFFAVDREFLPDNQDRFVLLDEPGDKERETEVVCALGAPGQKRDMIARWPGTRFATIIADAAFVASQFVEIGVGSILAPRVSVMAGVDIGDHVLLNTGTIVSHESKVGDYSTVSPGATLGGRVEIGRGVFIGIGAVVRDGVRIGDGAVVGAGALVLRDVGDFEVVVGAPAKVLRRVADWMQRI